MEKLPAYPFCDLHLAQRLERTEAASNAHFVEARARVFPRCQATWTEVAGAYAMFDGVESPLTQTFGLGLFQPVTEAVLDTLEQFFEIRNAPVFHEISPLADPALWPLLTACGYAPVEFTSVLYRPIWPEMDLGKPRNARLQVRQVGLADQETWQATAALGWSEYPEVTDFMQEVGQVTAAIESAVQFLAELEGEPIAAAGLHLQGTVALLSGASTVPTGRNQGAQWALLERRLQYAAAQGCTLAIMGASPGSPSQRNAERHGFRIAYTRCKWQKI
ncbi:GNAT family N-acetyltransferase [Catalinimonas alkaloidigena]|nr:GNAT family N-acetyltransferase [Catalinimonas alkaloidigena]